MMIERYCKKCGYSGPDKIHNAPGKLYQCVCFSWPIKQTELSRAEYEELQDELNLWKVRCQFMCSNYFRVASLDMGGRHTYTAIGRTVGRGYSFYEALDARKAAIDAALKQETSND
jgi:hypothetical protein